MSIYAGIQIHSSDDIIINTALNQKVILNGKEYNGNGVGIKWLQVQEKLHFPTYIYSTEDVEIRTDLGKKVSINGADYPSTTGIARVVTPLTNYMQNGAKWYFTGDFVIELAPGKKILLNDVDVNKPTIPTANLTVWLDAASLSLADGAGVDPWPNLGSGSPGNITGTPAPTVRANALNGKPVVRFTFDEGRIRGTGLCPNGSYDLTVIYVARMVGPHLGRCFTNTYPDKNYLVGMHTSLDEWLFDNGAGSTGVGWNAPHPWKLYENVSSETPRESRFFVNGIDKGFTGSSAGHDTRWNISGYDAVGNQETCDCEVAELITYDRPLSDTERIQVETYLKDKWGIV